MTPTFSERRNQVHFTFIYHIETPLSLILLSTLYLEKDRLSPNILASQWVNTVYADMQLWVDDKFVPRKAKKALKTHEWDKSVAGTSDDTKIGVTL